jgi:NAD(P)-dependent dehydrogenase (short-subunit alcohol dehydrogenase family)
MTRAPLTGAAVTGAAVTGATALVTGAGGGIGLAVAERLAAGGVAVLAADLKPAPAGLDPAISYVAGDLTEPGAIERLLASPVLAGSLDYLVNAAGVAWWERDGSALEIDDDTWNAVLGVNLDITRRLTVGSIPLLRRGSGRSIVNVASIAGLRNLDSPLDAYQVSKAAVVSLTRSLAQQLGPEGIRCNTVCPGAILTPMVEPIYARAPERRAQMEARTPLRRLGTPHDVACAVSFLLSPEASFITGTDLVIDGGWTIQTV